MDTLFKIINLPPIPDVFFSLGNLRPVWGSMNSGIQMNYNNPQFMNQQVVPAALQTVWQTSHSDYQSWLAANIPFPVTDKILSWSSLDGTPHRVYVHTDRSGDYSLNYVVNTGGQSVKTNWYIEDGHELHRRPKQIGQQSDSGPVDYSRLTCVDSFESFKGCWMIMRVNVLHDVTDITDCRTIWSAKFSDEQAYQWCLNR